MNKQQITALTVSTLCVALATGSTLWFQATHAQVPIMFEGYRQLAPFALKNVWWPQVILTLLLSLVLALPWWATAFSGETATQRRFSLFPFLPKGMDHLLTLLNVVSTLALTVVLFLLCEMRLQDFDPTQAEHMRLYQTALLLFWGAVYFLLSFLQWRHQKDLQRHEK